MLVVVKFVNGKYGLMNSLTGNILEKNGEYRFFKSEKKAIKKAQKFEGSLMRVIRQLEKKYGDK